MGLSRHGRPQAGRVRRLVSQVAFAAVRAPRLLGAPCLPPSARQRRQLGRLLLQLLHDACLPAAQRLEVGLQGEGWGGWAAVNGSLEAFID